MRLDRLLSEMGVGTRKELGKAIRAGKVSVNGAVVKDTAYKASEADIIIYDGQQVQYEQYVYYMLNKPAGVITATRDPKQPTVLDLITERKRADLYPVGRLDRDTEGLLLITNDGALGHRLLSPTKHVDKTYYVTVDKPIEESVVTLFQEGIQVDAEFRALPAKLVIMENPHEAQITVHEGKFHQIKRMFEAVGCSVVYLKRISMGPLALDEKLQPGEYRRLTSEEKESLRKQET